MEKTVNLKLPEVMELGREEVKEINGGSKDHLMIVGGCSPAIGDAGGAASAGFIVGFFKGLFGID